MVSPSTASVSHRAGMATSFASVGAARAILYRGGVPERFNGTVLKTVVRLVRTVGSNPTPSARFRTGQEREHAMQPVNLLEYEPLAREKLPEGSYGFIAGAAEDEVTLRENRAAFQRLQLRPRVLVDVSKIDPSTSVLGQRIEFPVLLAPVALPRPAPPAR